MKALSIVRRELLVAGKRPSTYWARTVVVAMGVAATLFIFSVRSIPAYERGLVLLITLAVIAEVLALLAGVFLTADSISEEKREGTLGLLFLTDLGGLDVVLGKLVAHSATAFAALFALLPILALPLMTGGVTLTLTLKIMLSLLLTLLLSLTVGLAVSAACNDSRKAALGTLVANILLAGVPLLSGILYAEFNRGLLTDFTFFLISPVFTLIESFRSTAVAGVGATFYWQSVALVSTESVLLLAVATVLSRSTWQQKVELPPRKPLKVWRARVLRRTRLSSLAPDRLYEWVCLRRGSSLVFRLFIGLLGVLWAFMMLVAITTRFWETGFVTAICVATLIHLLMKMEFAMESCRQLQEDARHGGLELLLVTPLSAENIVRGHRRAYRLRFGAAVALLTWLNLAMQLAIVVFHKHLHMEGEILAVFSTYILGGIMALHFDFRALAWVGAWRALRSPTHLKAALTTLAGMIGLPWVLGPVLVFAALSGKNESEGLTIAGIVIFALSAVWSVVLGRRARRNLLREFRKQLTG